MTSDRTPVCAQGRNLQQEGAMFSLTLPVVTIQQPPPSIFSAPVRIHSNNARCFSDNELKHGVREELGRVGRVLRVRHRASRRRARICVLIIKRTLWKNNFISWRISHYVCKIHHDWNYHFWEKPKALLWLRTDLLTT